MRLAHRQFLGNLGRWSGASLAAVIGGAAWLSTSGSAAAASWINRRHGGGWVNGRGGGWINGGGGGGSWVNRGGGSWVNRRGGAGWINRR
jgi:hypothetical protein